MGYPLLQIRGKLGAFFLYFSLPYFTLFYLAWFICFGINDFIE